jgi:signal peptidase I
MLAGIVGPVTYLDRANSRIPQPWRKIVDWLATIALAVGFVLAFEAEVAKPFRIPSASMEPTLHCARPAAGCRSSLSDRVIADRLAYRFRAPRRGEIVVFNAPPATSRCGGTEGGVFVKRLIGLPGERISERNGQVFVDGRPLAEPYVDPASRDALTRTWPRMPRDHYFFMGDNRANSCDSRTWGTVTRSSLIGPVVSRYWPLTRLWVHLP